MIPGARGSLHPIPRNPDTGLLITREPLGSSSPLPGDLAGMVDLGGSPGVTQGDGVASRFDSGPRHSPGGTSGSDSRHWFRFSLELRNDSG